MRRNWVKALDFNRLLQNLHFLTQAKTEDLSGDDILPILNVNAPAGDAQPKKITIQSLGAAVSPYVTGGGIPGEGTVTSVGFAAPSGFTTTGSPVTGSGVINLSYDAGYFLPTNVQSTQWDVAYNQRLNWDGGSTGLNAAIGRTSLGLGNSATLNVGTTTGTVAAGDDSRFVPAGGTTGQALIKSSGTDYDASWQTLTVSDVFVIACSDETSNLTAGTNKARFTMPYAGTLTAVKADVNTAPTGSTLVVDINEAGVSVLSTKLSIDAGETSSSTAATPPVISDSALANGAVISIDIDQIGSTVAGAGLKVTLYVTRS